MIINNHVPSDTSGLRNVGNCTRLSSQPTAAQSPRPRKQPRAVGYTRAKWLCNGTGRSKSPCGPLRYSTNSSLIWMACLKSRCSSLRNAKASTLLTHLSCVKQSRAGPRLSSGSANEVLPSLGEATSRQQRLLRFSSPTVRYSATAKPLAQQTRNSTFCMVSLKMMCPSSTLRRVNQTSCASNLASTRLARLCRLFTHKSLEY